MKNSLCAVLLCLHPSAFACSFDVIDTLFVRQIVERNGGHVCSPALCGALVKKGMSLQVSAGAHVLNGALAFENNAPGVVARTWLNAELTL